MAIPTIVLVPVARSSETLLRRASGWLPSRPAAQLFRARVLGPALTAIGRFLDARERASSDRFWV